MEEIEAMVDVEVSPATKTVDTKEVVNTWKEKLAAGLLTSSNFKEYWRIWVPRIYSPTVNESCLNWSFNEDDATRILFSPLEKFICDGEPATILNTLSQLDKPPSVCGRVFKFGEPTYSCRECGMDNTCVLCVDCFKKSEHRYHKYKMGTSSGGGCCDCGDKEAWKKAPFCDQHIIGTQESDEVSRSLPDELAERTRIVFDAVLWYAYNLLTLEHTSDLRVRDSQDELYDLDTYCTILYNDEVHTFEQVINTLNRVIKCTQRHAIEYVTNIDREGRAVVKCSNFQYCNELKIDIEKFTSRHGNKPLKVLVVPSHVVAHQLFAMKLLTWLQEFLAHGECFRAIFAEVALKPQQADPCIVKGILLRDSQLWKSARTHWHRLLISGMLLEYENKKALAKIFTKNYGNVMKDFIKDDHDHSFSVSSLSVQLFTVPTLAHHLIAYDDALFILLNTFISECTRKCNNHNKLEFERNSSTQSFKRAQYILYDLRYLLSAIPEVWTDDLRKSFLGGFSVMLNLFSMMQGMDSVTRQIGQHMEYEPEWESAFNLHIKLAFCISLALKWCGTDKIVLVKAYRAALKRLYEDPCYDPNDNGELKELSDYSILCINYDVSTKPISIHLPLSRFLSGLHLYLEKYGLSFDSPELAITTKPTPVQLIEPVLRTQVMIAQVHSGMWRRNGYALLNQLYFYHNVKCRTEMLDRDIVLLQIGASLIESNEFLIHLLNKFNLLNWANTNFEANTIKNHEEDCMRQTINLVEEFLQLLIVICGERWIPGISGISVQDMIKKEIIQHLCIKPLPHSELNKTIPEDICHETGLDDVIEELATFKKPTLTSGKGVYELKNEFFADYNVFYYHYTREELSKSEEAQRKRHKTAGELECCPPPILPKLKDTFNMIVNLLQCDVMLHIIQTVLVRSINLRALSFSEVQLHKVLHLIGYALQEEESKNYPFLLFSEKANRRNIPSLLEELSLSARVEAHKPLIRWVINKFKQVMKLEESSTEEASASISIEKPVDNEKERRAKLAAQRRAKIMAQMTAQQNSFMKENAKLFEEASAVVEVTAKAPVALMDTSESNEIVDQPIALGPRQTAKVISEKTHVCILCQEEQTISIDGSTLVLAGFVHLATVLCQNRTNEAVMDVTQHDALYLNSNLGPAAHTSTCGHVMHSTCWQKYYDNVMSKEHRRPYRLRHPASFDVDKQEFLCPLCECLSNVVLPLVPALHNVQPSTCKVDILFDDWLHCMSTATAHKKVNAQGIKRDDCCSTVFPFNEMESDSELLQASCPMHKVYDTICFDTLEEILGSSKDKFRELFPNEYPELSSDMKEMVQLYTQVTYTRGLNVNPHPNNRRLVPMAWKSCAYTLHAIEVSLRDSNKPLLGSLSSRQRDCLESIVRINGVIGCTLMKPKSTVIASHALKLLSMLLEHNSSEDECILGWDCIGILIPLTYSLPGLFSKEDPIPLPLGGALELHTLRLVFICHVTKILLTTDVDGVSAMDTEDTTSNSEMLNLLKVMNVFKENVSGHTVWQIVKNACIPFLRCCVLFYHYLTDVPAPNVLLEVGGDTFENMCSYLDLPTAPQELFASKSVLNLIETWCKHQDVITFLNGKYTLPIAYEPLSVNRLVELPTDYSELINTVSSFTCPNSDHEDSRNPTMCLVCGEVLCSQSYCCQTELNKVIVGACNYHAHKCGAGVGIFLRVRECEIMYLASPQRGCFVSPPYLDDYGETDQGLRRGNPLHLCADRYKILQGQWLNHSIHEEIARAIESSNNIVPMQWQHL